MFTVIAEDGRQYGPVDASQLRQWRQDGRISADTRIIDPISNQQVRAADLPELADLFAGPPQYAPPGPGNASWSQATGSAQPHYWTPPSQFGQSGLSPYGPAHGQSDKSKVAAGLIALFFGAFGVHRFYLGYTTIGIVQLVMTVLSPCTLFISLAVSSVWALIDAILIFTGSLPDADGRELRN